MTLFSASLVLVGVYFLVLFFLTYRAACQETKDDFSIGSRNIGLIGTTASLASGFRDGAGVVVWITLAILFGLYTLWLFFAIAVGLAALSLSARTIKREADATGAVTLSDFLRDKIGPRSAFVASVAILITALLYAVSQLSIAGNIFSLLFGISVNLGTAIVVGVIALYLVIGGYKTVIRTDVFQWFVIMLIFFIPLFLLHEIPTTSIDLAGVAPLDIEMIIGIVAISILVVYSSADVWQRVFSSKTSSVAQKSLLLTIPAYFVISLGVVLFGVFLGSLLGEVPEGNPFFALFTLEGVAPLVLAIMGVFVLASVMSTLDTQVFLFAQTFSRNVLGKSGKGAIDTTRIILIVLLAMLGLMATTVVDIIAFLFGAVTLATILAPVLLFYVSNLLPSGKETDFLVSISLVTSAAVYFSLFFTGVFENLLFTLVPASVSFTLLLLVSFFSRRSANTPSAGRG